METDRLKKYIVSCIILIPLMIVFAQGKLTVLGTPWYVPEILVMSALGGLIFLEKKIPVVHLGRNVFFFGLLLMAIGFFISIFFNDIMLHGYGRLKSWFFFPALYGMMLSYSLQRGMLSLELVLRSVFFGAVLIGISTLGSIFSGSAFSYDHRLHGFFSSPNQLAMLLGTALLIGIFRIASLWTKQGKEWLAFSFGTPFLLVLLLLTQSYMVIFSLTIAIYIGVLRHRNSFSQRQTLSFFFGLMLFIGTLLSLSSDKWMGIITEDDRSSLSSREMIWTSAIKMIEDHPFTGIGPGNFQDQYLAYQRYFSPYLEWSAPHPHNMFLDIWLEGGFLAFIGFTMLFLYWFFSAARYFWQKKNESASGALPFLLALYFLLIGLTDVPFLRNDLAYFFVTAFVISGYQSRVISDTSSHHDD